MTEGLTARWRRIYSNEWHEPAFQELSADERLVYFYLKTGPQSTSVGIYRISTAVAVEDIGNITPIEFDVRLARVCEAFGWQLDARARVLWIPMWLDENPPQSPNVCVAWRKLIVNLPDCDLKFEAANAISAYLKGKKEDFQKAFGKDLPKDFRMPKAKPEAKPKAQPKAKPEAYQGSSGSGDFSGDSGSAGAGALRAAASEEKLLKTPEPLLELAHQTLNFHNPRAPLNELAHVMRELGNTKEPPVRLTNAQAIDALKAAKSERRPS